MFEKNLKVCLQLEKISLQFDDFTLTKAGLEMAEKSYYDSYQAALYAAATSATTSQSEEPALEDEEWEEEDSGGGRRGNVLPFWGNQQTMNLNPLILTNIQNSPYYKSNLFDLKVF